MNASNFKFMPYQETGSLFENDIQYVCIEEEQYLHQNYDKNSYGNNDDDNYNNCDDNNKLKFFSYLKCECFLIKINEIMEYIFKKCFK